MSDELLKVWGINLRTWRTERGMTQAKLAEHVGVSVPTVSRWETGLQSITDGNKVEVAAELSVDVRVLFPLVRGVSA